MDMEGEKLLELEAEKKNLDTHEGKENMVVELEPEKKMIVDLKTFLKLKTIGTEKLDIRSDGENVCFDREIKEYAITQTKKPLPVTYTVTTCLRGTVFYDGIIHLEGSEAKNALVFIELAGKTKSEVKVSYNVAGNVRVCILEGNKIHNPMTVRVESVY